MEASQSVYQVGDRVERRFVVRAFEGAGPIGERYLAFDEEVEVEVALRVVHAHLLPDAATRASFVDRMQRSRALSHPHLLRVHAVLEDAGHALLAVQWAPGSTVASAIATRAESSPPSLAEARPLLGQVAAALAHAHAHDVALGDLRPASVVVLPDGVKVTSVGVALALPRDRYLAAIASDPEFLHLAPEVRGQGSAPSAGDVRSDVYSFAALAAVLLTGRDLAAARAPLAATDAAWAAVIERGLDADPMRRPPTVEALLTAFDRAAEGRKPRGRRGDGPATLPDLSGAIAQLATTPEATGAPPATPPPATPPPEATQKVDEEELRRLAGEVSELLETTRQVSFEEMAPLRAQSERSGPIVAGPPLEQYGSRPPLLDDDDELSLEAAPRPHAAGAPRPDVTRPAVPFASVRADEASDDERTRQVLLLDPEAAYTSPRVKLDPALLAEMEQIEDAVVDPPAPAPLAPATRQREDPFADAMAAHTARAEAPAPADGSAPVVATAPPPLPQAWYASPPVAPEEVGAFDDEPQLRPRGLRSPALVLGAIGGSVALALAALAVTLWARAPESSARHAAPPSTIAAPPSAITPAKSPAPSTIAREKSAAPSTIASAKAPAPAAGTVLAKVPALVKAAPAKPVATATASAPARVAASAKPVAPAVASAPAKVAVAAAASGCPAGMVPGPDRGYCIDAYEFPGAGQLPKSSVARDEAERLCAARGARLCTEKEWEHACRGPGGASYPYGASYRPTMCNTAPGSIRASGEQPTCRSGVGAFDMSGNVAEWVAGGLIKGGAAGEGDPAGRCSHHVRPKSGAGVPTVGFRCCSAASN